MILLDTNIFIYLAQGALDPAVIAEQSIAHASVTQIEALGYGALPVGELRLLEDLFDESHCLPLSDSVVDRAVALRQLRRMSLGDSIIAASALENDLTLWTANTTDFKDIELLKLYNPTTA